MQQPQSDEAMQALQSAILDRRTVYVNSQHGTACILPVEEYIRLVEIKKTLAMVVCRVQEGDILGVLQIVDAFSKWILEGGGESYTLEGGSGDARTL